LQSAISTVFLTFRTCIAKWRTANTSLRWILPEVSGICQLYLSIKTRRRLQGIYRDGEIYVWNRAPRLGNSPAAFQRLIAHVLQGVPHVNVYIEDTTIYTRTWAEHLSTLEIVFQELREAGLKAKSQKRVWAAAECKVLDSVVNEHGVKPDLDKVAAIDQLPVPRNVADVRSFLGIFISRSPTMLTSRRLCAR
jgi:hypothetical protein